jgi:hypothetical protein
MNWRRAVPAFPSVASLAALLVTLLPASAMADRHKAALGGGLVEDERSALWGINVTGDLTLKEATPNAAEPKKWMLSCVADITQVGGEHEGSNFSQTTLLVGLRYTIPRWRVETFGEALIGAAYERGPDSRTSAAGGFGIGVDVPFSKTKGGYHSLVVLRGRYGLHRIGGDSSDWYSQFSLGLVFRLPKGQ